MEITVNSELYKKVPVCQDISPGTEERLKSQSEQVMKRSRKLALEKSSQTHVLDLAVTLGDEWYEWVNQTCLIKNRSVYYPQ